MPGQGVFGKSQHQSRADRGRRSWVPTLPTLSSMPTSGPRRVKPASALPRRPLNPPRLPSPRPGPCTAAAGARRRRASRPDPGPSSRSDRGLRERGTAALGDVGRTQRLVVDEEAAGGQLQCTVAGAGGDCRRRAMERRFGTPRRTPVRQPRCRPVPSGPRPLPRRPRGARTAQPTRVRSLTWAPTSSDRARTRPCTGQDPT